MQHSYASPLWFSAHKFYSQAQSWTVHEGDVRLSYQHGVPGRDGNMQLLTTRLLQAAWLRSVQLRRTVTNTWLSAEDQVVTRGSLMGRISPYLIWWGIVARWFPSSLSISASSQLKKRSISLFSTTESDAPKIKLAHFRIQGWQERSSVAFSAEPGMIASRQAHSRAENHWLS